MNDEILEMIWENLTDEQLLELKERADEMEIRYKQSLYAALLMRCLIDTDEGIEVFL